MYNQSLIKRPLQTERSPCHDFDDFLEIYGRNGIVVKRKKIHSEDNQHVAKFMLQVEYISLDIFSNLNAVSLKPISRYITRP